MRGDVGLLVDEYVAAKLEIGAALGFERIYCIERVSKQDAVCTHMCAAVNKTSSLRVEKLFAELDQLALRDANPKHLT